LRYSHPPMTLAKPHEAGRDLLSMRWGLIPSWWKKTAKEVLSTFNARAETVATKPMFRSAFRRRCPNSGNYALDVKCIIPPNSDTLNGT
jgi:putative SOS response-associated peptidase YedK